MESAKFTALLGLIVPQVVRLIAEHYGWDERMAACEFYRSKVYGSLEQEGAKVWHFSPMMLFTLYKEEKQTGTFAFPEET